MKTREAYARDREAGIKVLEKLVGKNAVVPLDVATRFLPVLPEWAAMKPVRKTRKGKR